MRYRELLKGIGIRQQTREKNCTESHKSTYTVLKYFRRRFGLCVHFQARITMSAFAQENLHKVFCCMKSLCILSRNATMRISTVVFIHLF